MVKIMIKKKTIITLFTLVLVILFTCIYFFNKPNFSVSELKLKIDKNESIYTFPKQIDGQNWDKATILCPYSFVTVKTQGIFYGEQEHEIENINDSGAVLVFETKKNIILKNLYFHKVNICAGKNTDNYAGNIVIKPETQFLVTYRDNVYFLELIKE